MMKNNTFSPQIDKEGNIYKLVGVNYEDPKNVHLKIQILGSSAVFLSPLANPVYFIEWQQQQRMRDLKSVICSLGISPRGHNLRHSP